MLGHAKTNSIVVTFNTNGLPRTIFSIPWFSSTSGETMTHNFEDTMVFLSVMHRGFLKIPRARPTVERLGRPPADVRDVAFSSFTDGLPRPPPPRLILDFFSSSLDTDSSPSSSCLPSSSASSSSSSSAGSSSPSGANRNSQIRSPSSSLVPTNQKQPIID